MGLMKVGICIAQRVENAVIDTISARGFSKAIPRPHQKLRFVVPDFLRIEIRTQMGLTSFSLEHWQ